MRNLFLRLAWFGSLALLLMQLDGLTGGACFSSAWAEQAPSAGEATPTAAADGAELGTLVEAGGKTLLFTVLLGMIAIGVGVWKLVDFWAATKELNQFLERLAIHPSLTKNPGNLRKSSEEQVLEAYLSLDRTAREKLVQHPSRLTSIPSMLAMVEHQAAHGAPMESGEIEDLLFDRLDTEVVPRLNRGLSILPLVAKLAPMLGLFGTVWGMIGAFSQIATQTNVNPGDLAENIGYALVTTAGGLLVAIPVLALHTWCRSRLRHHEFLHQRYVQQIALKWPLP